MSPVGISGIEGLGAGFEFEAVVVCVGELVGESLGANVCVGVGVTIVGVVEDEGVSVAVGCGGCSRVSVFTKKTS